MANIEDYDIDPEAYSLRNTLDRVLETVVSVYESYNVPLPSRRYWTFGQPVVDYEQAVVSFVQMYLGAPGDQATDPRHCEDPRTVVVSIQVSREVTVPKAGKAPTPEQIQKDAYWQAVDSWVLMDSIQQFDVWGDYPIRGLGVIATVTTEGTSGGYATTTMNLTLAAV